MASDKPRFYYTKLSITKLEVRYAIDAAKANQSGETHAREPYPYFLSGPTRRSEARRCAASALKRIKEFGIEMEGL